MTFGFGAPVDTIQKLWAVVKDMEKGEHPDAVEARDAMQALSDVADEYDQALAVDPGGFHTELHARANDTLYRAQEVIRKAKQRSAAQASGRGVIHRGPGSRRRSGGVI